MLEKLQETAFEMIAHSGTARSLFMEAIAEARNGRIQAAAEKLKAGQAELTEAHKAHFEYIQKEANGEELPFSILFMHAEDQLMTTELLKTMGEEMMVLHEKVNELEGKVNECENR